MARELRWHTSHWGVFRAEVEDGTVVAVHPSPSDSDPSPLLGNIPGSLRHRARIAQPMVRAGWLDRGPGPDGRRGPSRSCRSAGRRPPTSWRASCGASTANTGGRPSTVAPTAGPAPAASTTPNYWCGGNPFHHHQHLGRLRRALARPETIVVHDPFWTPMARHADVVLPATVTLERNDIGGSPHDSALIAMHRAVPPYALARSDYDIFADLRPGDLEARPGVLGPACPRPGRALDRPAPADPRVRPATDRAQAGTGGDAMRPTPWARWLLAALLLLLVAGEARAAGPYVLVSGRWDNTVVVVDLAKALDPANDGTSNAVINRVRVTPDVDAKATGTADTPASGQPVNVVIPPDGPFAFVVNHSGRATPAAATAFQHGHAGTITILDLRKALDPATSGITDAMVGVVPTGGFGPVGLVVTPDRRFALVSNSEGDGDEEGGRTIAVVDLAARTVVRQVTQAYGKTNFPCPPTPLPHAGPHPTFGCFPDSNGLGLSLHRGGHVFAANGGTDDVSVIDLTRALAGDPGAEVARIPVAVGPWGLAVSPDGRLVAVANRESARTGVEGNTISILDVERAVAGGRDAEVARVLVGTNNPTTATRTFSVAFTPDGKRILATNFRSNNVSVVDVERALAQQPAEVARIPLQTPGGGPSRPRGVVVTADGRYAVVTGAARGASGSGVLWILDLASTTVVGRVTGVGNEAYLLDILPAPRP